MRKGRELAKNTLIIGLGKLIVSVVSFVLLPFYVSELTAAEYGFADMVVVYVTLSGSLITLRLELALFRWIVDARNSDKSKSKIISTVLSTLAITISLATIIYIALVLIFDIPYAVYVYLYAITTVLFNVLVQITRGFGDNVSYTIANVLLGLSSAFSSLILLFGFKMGVVSLLIGYIVGNLVAILYVIYKVNLYKYVRHMHRDSSNELRKNLLKYSVPMIPDQISNLGIYTGTKIVVASTIGLVASGLYAVAGRFASILLSLVDVFEVAWIESVAVNIKDPNREGYFSRILDSSIRLFWGIAIILLLVVSIIFPIIIDAEFMGAYQIIPLLVIGYLWNSLAKIFGAIFLGLKKTVPIMGTTIGAAFISLGGTLVLVGYMGLWAPVISVLVAYMFLALSRHYLLRTKLGVNIKVNLKSLLFVGLLMVISLIIYYVDFSFALRALMSLFLVTVVAYINRDVYKMVLDILRPTR